MGFKLPSFADVGFDDPRAVGGLPNYPQNDPGAAGLAVLGKGVSDVGNAALDIAADKQRKKDKINSALAGADLDANLMRTSAKLKHERDPAKIDEMKGQLQGYLDRAAATITDPDVRQLWAATHKNKIDATAEVADAQHRKVYNDRFLAGASQQLDEQARLAAQAGDPAQREQAKHNIGNILGSLESNGIIDAAKGQALAQGYGEKVIIGTVNWLDANKDPIGASRFLRENLRHIDPDKAESLSRHLRPLEDREIGRAFVRGPRPGAAGGDAGGRVAATLRARGWSDAAIVGALNNSITESSLNPGAKGAAGEFGLFQFHPGSHLTPFRQQYKGDSSPEAQANYMADVVEKDMPGYSKSSDARAATGQFLRGFEKPKDQSAAAHAARAANETTSRTILGRAGASAPGGGGSDRLDADQNDAPAAGEPIPLDRPGAEPAPAPGVPDIRAQVDRIKAAKERGELSEEQADFAYREVQQDQQQIMLGHERAESNLALAIARGEKGSADVEDEWRAGHISDTKRTQFQLQIIEEQKKQAVRDQMILRTVSAGAGGAPLDPKSKDDRAGLNLHYDAMSKMWQVELQAARALDPNAPDDTLARSLTYSKQYGMVPTALQARIRGGLHSGRPELAIEAARTIARLRNVNPQLVGEIGDENDLRFAELISIRDSMGVPPERALQMAVDELKAPKAVREARDEEYEARGKGPTERRLADTQWIEKQQNTLWVNDPNVDTRMRREFDEVAKSEFHKTGNLEASRRRALDNINRVWGRSRVVGDYRYMKYAPEKFYGAATLSDDDNAAWMREQLVADVAKDAFVVPGDPIDASRIKLLHDESSQQGGWPVYQVWVAPSNGGAWEMVRKPNGEPRPWHPDWANSAEFKRRQEGRARTIDELRARRVAPQPTFLDRVLRGPATMQEGVARGPGEEP